MSSEWNSGYMWFAMFNLSVSQPTLHISFLCEDIAKGSKTEVEEINEAEDSDE